MHARTLGAATVTAALLLLPVGAHASGPEPTAPSGSPATRFEEHGGNVTAAEPTGHGPTGGPTDTIVVLGLVALVGTSLLVALTGRRPDDDEPTD